MNAGQLADFGDRPPQRSGPPKTILAPPPPPAAPPPATRSVKASPSPRTADLGQPRFGQSLGSPQFSALGPPPVPTRAPPSMGAPVVPQHRNEVLHKMLRGLEDDSLTVADVLGVLETELRSGAPSAAPLSEQFERYIGPLAEVSGPKPGRGPAPLQSGAPLLGPAPNALAPSFGGAGGEYSTPRKDIGGQSRNRNGEDGPQHIIVNCARCAVLEQQVKALAQSLSGLGARMFNWSLAHCKENNERNGLWHLIVKYLQPVMSVDQRIAETCTGLQSACGTTGAHVPSESLPSTRRRGNGGVGPGTAQGRGGTSGPRSVSPGPVWQPPGLSASVAGAGGFTSAADKNAPGGGRTARFAENPLHQAAAPDSPSSLAPSTPGGLPPSAMQMRAKALHANSHQGMPATPSSPSSPKPSQGFGPMVVELTVRFGASRLAKKLNGVYEMVPGVKVNERPIYASARRNIIHLSDGTWAIKDGPDDDVDADVYAYVKDPAWEPQRVMQPWNVAADGDGFVLDPRGAITPGRSETGEGIEAASRKAAKLAREAVTAGVRAEVAVMDRADRDELRQLRVAAQRQDGGPTSSEVRSSRDEQKAKPVQKGRGKGIAGERDAEVTPSKATEPAPFDDESGTARLRITIVQAQGLRKADLMGGSDPYVVCEVPGKGALGKTPVVNNTQRPVWNHVIETRYTIGDKLKFTVWDDDAASTSDLLSETVLKMDRFFPGGFRGELALKDAGKDTKATLEIKIDVVGMPPEETKMPIAAEREAAKAPVAAELEAAKADSARLLELQRKLEAATAREQVLQRKLESEKVARATAEAEADHHAALATQAGQLRSDDYDYDDDDGWDSQEDATDEEEDPDIRQYRTSFEQFDTDNSGTISVKELKVVMDGLGRPQSESELRIMLERVDKEGDGVDFQEFLVLIDNLNACDDQIGELLGKYNVMFDKFDINEDGHITTHELQLVLEASGQQFEQSEVDRLVEDLDVNEDGKIDFKEFMKLMQLLTGGNLKQAPIIAMDLTKVASLAGPTQQSKLAPSDKKRIKAYLKRKGYPEVPELAQAVNQHKKAGGFMKTGYEYPLHTAAVENPGDMVWLLLECGADRDQKNSDGKTAYEAAQKADKGRGTHKKVLELLQP